jgi:hypothetical protein
MPATFISQRTGRVVSDADVRALLDSRAPQPSPSGRKAFTDRLGLPASATDAEFFAALDARLAQRRRRPPPLRISSTPASPVARHIRSPRST